MLFILYLFSIIPGYFTALSDYYGISNATNNNNSAWLSRIPDSRPIRNLSIPGTHNSVSFHGGVYAQCQSLPLSEQFKAGIRFLDIRIHHDGVDLPIYHGIMHQRTNFNTVLNDTVKFLNQHLQEVVFMRIREESKESDLTQSLLMTVMTYVNMYPVNRFWMSVNWPTLQQARGKIVILQNFDTHNYVWVPYSSMSIDDHWNVAGLSRQYIRRKWTLVRDHLKKSVQHVDPRVHLTWTSGSSFLAMPYAVSQKINKRLWKLLRRKKWRGSKGLGIIATDFPGDVLIQQIVSTNFDSADVKTALRALG